MSDDIRTASLVLHIMIISIILSGLVSFEGSLLNTWYAKWAFAISRPPSHAATTMIKEDTGKSLPNNKGVFNRITTKFTSPIFYQIMKISVGLLYTHRPNFTCPTNH